MNNLGHHGCRSDITYALQKRELGELCVDNRERQREGKHIANT